MWLFASRKKGSVARTQPRRLSRVPQVEMLEDRCLLSSPGSLDTTFGSGGLVTTNFSKKSADIAWSIAVQTDGKIVAAGIENTNQAFEVARYNANGTLDSSFGTGGTVLTQYSTSQTGYDVNMGFVLQPDGKIVVGATPYASNGSYELARYNTNGTLDTTFGPNHTGIVNTNFSGATAAIVAGLTIESVNGSPKLVAGVWWNGTISGGTHNSFALARYNLDGSLDNSFGVGGEAVSPAFPSGCFAKVESITTQADGKIVLGGRGEFQYGSPNQFILARYDTSGNLDPSFGSGGLAALSSYGDPWSLAIQSDSKIVAGGDIGSSGGLARFNVGVSGQTDGSLDTSFGAGGIVSTGSILNDVMIQTNGKIVAADGVGAVDRYNADGSLDTGFGSAGTSSMPSSSVAFAVALQADGKIVAAGRSAYSNQTNYDFAVARFQGDPIPVIGSFTASPNSVKAGSNVTLTASNITDANPNSSITQVAFYRDSNGDGKLEAGTDTLLGFGTQTSPGVWTLTVSTAGLAPGSYTLFAQAEDNYGVFSDAVAVSLLLM